MAFICYQHTTRALRDRESLRLEIPPRPSSPAFSEAAQDFFHARGPEYLQPIVRLSQSCIFIGVVSRMIYKDGDAMHRYQWSPSPSSRSAASQSSSLSSFQLSSGISALNWGQQHQQTRNHPEWGDILCVHTCPWQCPHCVLPQTLTSWQELFLCLPHSPLLFPWLTWGTGGHLQQ